MIGGLGAQDELRVLTYTLELLQEMTRAMTLLQAVTVTSGNTHFAQILDSVGRESPWAQAFRGAAGLTASDVWARGQAAVRLFLEAAAHASPHFRSDERKVIDQLKERVKVALHLS